MTSDKQLAIEDLEAWLTDRIAAYDNTGGVAVTTTTPLTDLGLDSVYALALCGDIEDEFGIEVEPTIAWDHPTIKELAAALDARIGG